MHRVLVHNTTAFLGTYDIVRKKAAVLFDIRELYRAEIWNGRQEADMIRFLGIYSVKSLSKHKSILLLMLVAQLAATFLLSATFFMVENIEAFSLKYAEKLNHGDLSLEQTHLWFGDKEYEERSINFENMITAQGIRYYFEQYLAPGEDAMLSVDGGKTIEGDLYFYRWVDFDEFDRFSIEKVNVQKQSVVLSETLARRLSAKEGDTLNICYRLAADPLHLPIGAIVPDGEIKIQDANKGYLFFDLSFYKEMNQDSGIDFDHAWQKRYYFDGTEDTLKRVEKAAAEVFREDFETVYINDIVSVAEDFFSFPVALLTVFTVICFAISGLILVNLLALILESRRKESAILNAYGLSRMNNVIFHIIEMLCMLIPVGILGISLGYICFRVMLHVTTSLGIYSIANARLFFSICRIICVYLLLVLFFAVPYIVISDGNRPMNVLREKGSTFKLKYILLIVCICMFIYRMIAKYNMLASVFIKAIIGILIFYILFKLWIKFVGLIRLNSYVRIGLAFLKKSRIRVPVQLLTYTVCFSVTLITLLLWGTLSSIAESEIRKESDCNVKIIADYGDEPIVQQFLSTEKINNYYIIYAYAARYDNTLFELQVYDFDHYNGVMKERVKSEAGITSYFSKNYGLKANSVVNVETVPGVACTLIVGDISYITPGMEMRQRAMAITKEGIDLADAPDQVLYFLNLSKTQQKALLEYSEAQQVIRVLSVEDIVNSATSGMQDNRIMFHFIAVVFFIVTFICVLSCSIITYLNRIREFAVYFACGADCRIAGKIILFENLVIVFSGIICGLFLFESLFPFITGVFQFELEMDYRWCVLIMLILITMSVTVTKVIAKMINLEKAVKLLRSE